MNLNLAAMFHFKSKFQYNLDAKYSFNVGTLNFLKCFASTKSL